MTSHGNQLSTKISGYLEKKGRLRIGSLWKKYWFVLEGRLLLYYRSKDEYEAISPCKGTINLCPPCTIKPAAATSCIFQIEGRATTVNLRAENRFEQERWMQALLNAIDQSKSSPSRLSHFRYSFDELPMPYQNKEIFQNGLQRQSSAPYSISIPKQDIIGRTQLIAAQNYGGSLDTIRKHTSRFQHFEAFRDKPSNIMGLNKSLSLHNESIEVIVENDQYSIIQEENSLDVIMDERTSKTITKYKNASLPNLGKMPIVDTNQYSRSNNETKTRERNGIRNKVKKSESLYERISSDPNKFNAHEIRRLRRKNSNIYERISSSSSSSEKLTKLYNQYSIVKKKSQESLQFHKEPEYSTPINREDHNKNTLIVDNDQYLPGHNNVLHENEYYKVDPAKELEDLYEDPDVIRKTNNFEPLLPPRPNVKKIESPVENSRHSTPGETKNKKGRLHILAQLIKSDKKQEPSNQSDRPKKKRSTSFLHRMLRRKEKQVHVDEEVVYEVIDKDQKDEKPKDGNDMQMLQELQKILETRKTLLQKKLSINNTLNTDDDKQNITQSTEKVKDHNGMLITEAEDLDKQKSVQDSNHKVKDLIHKFNDLHNEDEILLRKTGKRNLQRSETISGVPQTFSKLYIRQDIKRESDELTNLLNELSKVTSAPVLTPGVTSSLTTPVVSDDEWMQVIPIRYRRLSDPDYDIPRPHSSLRLKNRINRLQNDSISATRFFGPVLLSAETSVDPQSLSSMDPDSLEIAESSLKIKNAKQEYLTQHGEKSASISSYRSHKYPKTDDVIYLQPKSILFNTKMKSHLEENSVDAENDKNSLSPFSTVTEETFIDSLEPLTESTYF